eukprot:CAMPEP_0170281362 /NCGR_PEP_ID=MMETSP0116_2-20130129/40700_1 /TAXON_ID=400756 /ORGANISM="Durinskia baltica, Strain CSIRO CS-38" /LENGTH=175 /DNA_ID=CAMNT_0010532703 /DNA_START=90 /DNA_END=614 /DNA_ORIENTATION=+
MGFDTTKRSNSTFDLGEVQAVHSRAYHQDASGYWRPKLTAPKMSEKAQPRKKQPPGTSSSAQNCAAVVVGVVGAASHEPPVVGRAGQVEDHAGANNAKDTGFHRASSINDFDGSGHANTDFSTNATPSTSKSSRQGLIQKADALGSAPSAMAPSAATLAIGDAELLNAALPKTPA